MSGAVIVGSERISKMMTADRLWMFGRTLPAAALLAQAR